MNLTSDQSGRRGERPRYALLDCIRGLAVLSMIAYHGAWDCVYLFGLDWPWYRSEAAYVWQQSICWTFILLAGFCQPLGKRPLRHGLTVFGVGALLSLVTFAVMPQSRVLFGVLTLLGSCMLLAVPLKPLLARVKPAYGLLVSALLFALTRNVNAGFLGFEGWNLVALPSMWYRNLATAYLGFPPADFYSTDYFPLLAWLFLFLAGYFLCLLLRQKDRLRHLEWGRAGALNWIGRHALLIYILHQPLLFGLLTLFF